MLLKNFRDVIFFTTWLSTFSRFILKFLIVFENVPFHEILLAKFLSAVFDVSYH